MLKGKKLKSTRAMARAVNGQSFRFVGTVKAKITIGRITIDQEILVSEDALCPSAMLIGMDIMSKLDSLGVITIVRPHAGFISVGDCKLPILSKTEETGAFMDSANALEAEERQERGKHADTNKQTNKNA